MARRLGIMLIIIFVLSFAIPDMDGSSESSMVETVVTFAVLIFAQVVAFSWPNKK
ncbi:MAG: hypothetical protein AAGA22_07675 [Pseudomonadota bacterium]